MKERRGAVVVELALVAPFMVAMMLGICELGQALKVQAVLSEAARKGCAAGVRAGGSTADVVIDAQAALSANGLPAASATITVLVNGQSGNAASAQSGDKLTVTIAIPTAQVTWSKSPYFMGATQSQSASMLKQG